jgi:histidyl-tRNA synthetase
VIFEAVAPGMPGSIASGGRYDHLIAALGGPDSPAVGGSLGVERILPLLEQTAQETGVIDVAVAVMGEELATASFHLATAVRRAGVRTGVYLGASGKLGRQLKWASEQGVRYTLLYGAAEHAEGVVTVRDMDSGEQTKVPVAEVGQALAGRLAGR